MSWKKIVENEYVSMRVSPEMGIIHHTFHQPISGKPFRDYLNLGLETLMEYDIKKWLSDDRKNSEIPEDDMQWSMDDWGERCVEAGWKYWAIVLPEDLAGRESMTDLRDYYLAKGVTLKVFITLHQAMEWLETIDQENDDA